MHIFRFSFFGSLLWLILALTVLVFAVLVPRGFMLMLAFVAGMILVAFRITPDIITEKNFQNLVDKTVTISGNVQRDPDKSEGKSSLILVNPEIDGNSFSGKVYVTFSSGVSEVRRGDKITINGKVGEGFGTYVASMYRPELKAISRPEPGDFFLDFRDFFAGKIREFVPEKESGVALGYLLGIRNGVDEGFEAALCIVGLTHIIVASGTHLSILTSFAKKIFGKISRFSGFAFAGLLVVSFVGITGLTPSMSRAGLVALTSLVAWYLGRDMKAWRIILLAMAITLLYAPTNLLDLAWLLSFASYIGILIIAPILADFFFGKVQKPGFIANTVIVSLSATLLCTPILLYFYGSVSLISILANLLILPTISAVMIITLLTGVFSCFELGFFATIFGNITRLIIDYHFAIVNFLSEQTAFLIKIESGNLLVFALYLIFVPALLIPFNKRLNKNSASTVMVEVPS